ncbi:MAG: GNAT family N-acetyltransferase [Saccharospirillaceae bacterium]|nr:GNAT family N-acetyltransferase [Pseudomonadales bacterium]NRB81193.1 GNAT family N-acetyltransferase [Saccharospirillaceae bacterium]
MFSIRSANLGDSPYLYDICARTALDGEDARPSMRDPNKVGHYFAVPYLHFDLSSCFVLSENGLPKGYILGTTHTQNYTQWLNDKWLKQIIPLYPKQTEHVSQFDAFLSSVIHSKTQIDERLKGYDAHFHIDLLEPYQNAGWGKKLVQIFLEHCQTRGAKKLFLMVSKTNLRALNFYKKVGFDVIFKDEAVVAIGLDIDKSMST